MRIIQTQVMGMIEQHTSDREINSDQCAECANAAVPFMQVAMHGLFHHVLCQKQGHGSEFTHRIYRKSGTTDAVDASIQPSG